MNESEKIKKYSKFKEYKSFDEYVDDLMFCLMHFSRYNENEAKNFTESQKDMVKRMFDAKCPPYDLAMEYYPICG